MAGGDFHLVRLLSVVSGTSIFRDYCRARGLPPAPLGTARDVARWARSALPPDTWGCIERELAAVSALADAEGNAHLLASGDAVPPDDVPGGAPLALWFLLNQQHDFREVFLHHVPAECETWRSARGPAGRPVAEVLARADALGVALRDVFRHNGGQSRCVVDALSLPDGVWFHARVADRMRVIEGFTARGAPTLYRVRAAVTLLFVYDPKDGSIRLCSPLQSADQFAQLLWCFGRSVLGAEVTVGCDSFDLDRLKEPFHPPPDAADMMSVRVRAIHLRYPSRLGRRLLKLETLPGDDPMAIDELLAAHAGGAGELTVTHAALEVRLLVDGRVKDVPVRLWRDHCNLDGTRLGERLRECLRRWKLCRG